MLPTCSTRSSLYCSSRLINLFSSRLCFFWRDLIFLSLSLHLRHSFLLFKEECCRPDPEGVESTTTGSLFPDIPVHVASDAKLEHGVWGIGGGSAMLGLPELGVISSSAHSGIKLGVSTETGWKSLVLGVASTAKSAKATVLALVLFLFLLLVPASASLST